MHKKEYISKIIFYCFIISAIASLGSLFFSEFMNFIPCTMCWYQRIFMYPLAILFFVNLLNYDENIFKYAVTLAFLGFLFSLYHNLLMWGIISEDIVPCKHGVPCSTEYFEYLGFINIPFLSLSAFSLILFLLLLGQNRAKKF
ncbi:disulfide bond formation protein B [Halarcobacter anaerophilus]|jgi:disulfide bond formation protein DsbB|uniref:Disulfide bond formation protein B n=1 Tax=Halarcobacter anaerophilus TaxID=877500 RepID=A0A4Q0Y3Q8_9BACT|nr:disulfide bond formation protein B [Halarcobacter anaerophilus]QDF28574.1 protein disulfide oxidoreductase [Halarcobacter anaerophilus]RXJ63299.1 disulfide bond formation protein B [Halarcobacter anaerophilus]